ncbi:MAG: type VI secretion system baseplate subunit TssG [Pseudomonadota bacterium]
MAPTHRARAAPVSGAAQPWESRGFLAYLREVERAASHLPRIGRSRSLAEEPIALRQDPYLAFPDTDLAPIQEGANAKPVVSARFMGFFGPHGALPINTTEEVLRWSLKGDDAFVRFTDIFATRFMQLFFRAWSDSKAISQYDHDRDDRFQLYLLSFVGMRTEAFRTRDDLPPPDRAALAGLATGRVKSPVRLRQMIEHRFGVKASIEEHVPIWMTFEEGAQNRLGARSSTLGRDMHVGAKVASVSDAICVHLTCRDIADYARFLPERPGHAQLAALVHWYLGRATDVQVSLALPRQEIVPARLGATAELSWMAALPVAANDDTDVVVTRYTLRSPAAA